MKRRDYNLYNEMRAHAFIEQMNLKHAEVLGQIKNLPNLSDSFGLLQLLESCENSKSDLYVHEKFHEEYFLKSNLLSLILFFYTLEENLKDWGKKLTVSSILLLEEQYYSNIDYRYLFPEHSEYEKRIESENVKQLKEHKAKKAHEPYDSPEKSSCSKSLERVSINAKVCNDTSIVEHETNTIVQTYVEGAEREVSTTRYERDSKARLQCIKIHGTACAVCGIDFEKMYGELGKGFIHVHHIVPIHTIGQGYKVNPATDLVPVCPNCHAMLHRGLNADARTIEELKSIIKK